MYPMVRVRIYDQSGKTISQFYLYVIVSLKGYEFSYCKLCPRTTFSVADDSNAQYIWSCFGLLKRHFQTILINQ